MANKTSFSIANFAGSSFKDFKWAGNYTDNHRDMNLWNRSYDHHNRSDHHHSHQDHALKEDTTTDASTGSTDVTAMTQADHTTQTDTTDASTGTADVTATTQANDATQTDTTDASTGSAGVTATTQVDDATQTGATDTNTGSTDVTATTHADHATQTGATDVTATTQADDVTQTVAADSGNHLCDNAFSFSDKAASIDGSSRDVLSDLLSNAQGGHDGAGLDSEISGMIHELQGYVGEHHLTAPDAHKLVEAIHAKMVSSVDFLL